MNIEQLRSHPRATTEDWNRLADASEKFLLNPSNPISERLEAGRILNETQGVEEDFTEKDLKCYGGISGPSYFQEFKKK